MTFMRVTDNGCGIAPEDAPTAFLRHATSKLRSAEDLAAISTMGFRGEALAAIASVSRIDLLTKTAGSVEGISLHLEGGTITEQSEAGCPDGTTIIVRDLFFNTPARMKFMKSDATEVCPDCCRSTAAGPGSPGGGLPLPERREADPSPPRETGICPLPSTVFTAESAAKWFR